MSDVLRYLERAEQLELVARDILVPEHRQQLLRVAADWRHMAEQVEQMEQRRFLPHGFDQVVRRS